jgi:hypothetical protein
VADARTPGDLVDARVDAALRETLAGRFEQPVEVSLRVRAEGYAGDATASASIWATCRARRSTSSAASAAITNTALPANA